MSIIEIEAYESLVKEFGQEKAKLIITALQTLFAKQDYVTKDYLEESLAKQDYVTKDYLEESLTKLEAHTATQIAELKAHTDVRITESEARTNTLIVESEARMEKKIHETKNYILKWMFGMWFSLIVFILASIFLKH